ncbi:hypothetical protein [Ottowia testudinis]|uniref:Uncharacterized protein n=1 Tax=Ottowia testudinis TaxID=2816950 RepID=A0A975CFN4_9BURK|nr:hypothetical protein [Ottowia testudinis]QTD44216.1 hypothetical protein J1M35_13920 [Ottowia testudinis]
MHMNEPPARPATTSTTPPANNGHHYTPPPAPPVIRNYSLTVDAFDHLKAMQRMYSREAGRHVNNSEALERILQEHEAATVEASRL